MPEGHNNADLPATKEVNLPPSSRNPILHPGPLPSVLLACLFAAGDPVDRPTLAEKLSVSVQELDDALADLKKHLETGTLDSLMIIESGDLVQIGVRPQYMTPIMAIRNPKVRRLSDAALETIAIIAMKQPCTRKEIEDMRQKDSEGTIATLREARFIQDIGHLSKAGTPALYSISDYFLISMGLKNMSELRDQIRPHLEGIATGIKSQIAG